MTVADLDSLFVVTSQLAKNWWDTTATPEQKAWVDELAEMIRDRGREPTTWGAVHEAFMDDFGVTSPSESTLRKYVRQRVEQ